MSFSVGIVGFPNVGKSTLFQTITKKQVSCENYPFCTIDPNIGVVSVIDNRVDKIAEITGTHRKIYPTIEFVDIAGLVEGASKGEGLGNKFLANIREVDVIVYVLRNFENDNVPSSLKEINPLKELELLDIELILKDMEVVEKRIESLSKEARSLEKEKIFELNILEKVKKILQEKENLSEENFPEKERSILSQYRFLTMKPKVYLLNGKKEEVGRKIIEKMGEENLIVMDVSEEKELENFSENERNLLGLSRESSINELIEKSYNLLGYITFFTVNPEETRAWKIKRGFKAPEAAGVVHTDFKKGFIKAEVINYEDFAFVNGYTEARKKGLMRTEGKEYIIQDGDIIEIKFKN